MRADSEGDAEAGRDSQRVECGGNRSSGERCTCVGAGRGRGYRRDWTGEVGVGCRERGWEGGEEVEGGGELVGGPQSCRRGGAGRFHGVVAGLG